MIQLQEINFKIIFIALAIIWSLPWKGWALWRSARRGERIWFVAILIINTLAVLEIIYLFIFSKDSENENVVQNSQKIIPPKTA